jgi:NADH pyrophosphatase NudC (nudix superfamily)
MSILEWRHCPRCAGPLTAHAQTDDVHVACPACGFVQYDNPAPTTLAMVLRGEDEVLLARRAHEPNRGRWDTVGGFLNPGETAEECVVRELREELGVTVVDVRPAGTYVSTYGDGGRRTIGMAFTCALPAGARIELSEENLEVAWFRLDDVPELAFQDSRDAVADLAAGRLRPRAIGNA